MDEHSATKARRYRKRFAFPDVEGGLRVIRSRKLHLAPAVSVVLPCFSDTEITFRKLAINSILLQSYANFELFALTDTLDSLDAQLFHADYPRDPRLVQLAIAAPASLRAIHYGQALRRSRGGYVLVLPTPVILRPNALQEMLAELRQSPHREFCYFGGPGFRTTPVPYDLMLRADLLKDAALVAPRELLGRVGLPDPHVALSRHFLWDFAVRLMHYSTGVLLNPSPAYMSASPRSSPRVDDSEELRVAIARRMMAHQRTIRLLRENWYFRPITFVNESLLPGYAQEEIEFLCHEVRRLCIEPGDHVAANAVSALLETTHQKSPQSVRVTILTTCTFLDTANVYVEQPFLEIARNRPLHYRLLAAQEAREEDIRDTDVLLLSRTLFAGWERALALAKLQRERGRCTLFVMDDDLLDIPVDITINEPIPVAQRFEAFLPWVDGLISASPHLKQRMQLRYPHLSVHVIDNSCCASHAPAQRRKEPRDAEVIRVALTLTSSAIPRLRAFADGLNAIAEEVRDRIELHVFGEVDPVRNLLPFRNKVFHRHRPYLEYLALLTQLQLDLAVIPLPADHEFYQCKTAIKYYEFGGMGIPGIYSRVPIYENVIRHGITGWLVNNTSEEWSGAITQLVCDASLRMRLALAGRSDVMQNHHISQAADLWWRLLGSSAAACRTKAVA